MLGINTIKQYINDASEYRRLRMTLDELGELSQSGIGGGLPHFMDPQPMYISSQSASIGLTDRAVSSMEIFEMMQKDTYVSGIMDQIVESVFRKGWYFTGSPAKVKEYSRRVKEQNIETLLRKRIDAKWGAGGGNYLSYTVKNKGKLQMKVMPFLSSGVARVAVWGDDRYEEIEKYEIIDPVTQMPLFTLNPQRDYVEHGRYAVSGDYRFSSNPAKRAVYWYVLKKYIAGANLSSFQNGLQEPTILSLDYKGMAALATAFNDSSNKVGGKIDTMSYKFTSDPIKFFKEQTELTRQIFKDELVGVRNANKTIMSKVPVTVTKTGRDNRSMETVSLIEVCNQEMGYALRTSQGILNTKNSKYSNAEVEADNFETFVIEAIKNDSEKWVTEQLMPIIDPLYNSDTETFRLGRDPDAEDIAIYQAKTDRTAKQAEIITKLINTGYTLNLETGEIIENTSSNLESKENKNKNVDKQKAEDKSDTVIDNSKDPKKKTENRSVGFFDKTENIRVKNVIEKALDSADYRKFEKLIRESIANQITFYVENKLAKYKETELKKAQDKLEIDLPALSSSGLPVNTLKAQERKFAERGAKEFEDNGSKRALSTYRSSREVAESETEDWDYPVEILEIIDAKSQVLLKGWDSLSGKQRELMNEYFADYKNYQGIDKQTSAEINTIIQKNLENGKGVEQATIDIMASVKNISEFRAFRIAQTETSQALAVTRRYLYTSNGYRWKLRVTVDDDRVRATHRADQKAGWIEIDKPYPATGNMSTADAILCRCFERYSDEENKPE